MSNRDPRQYQLNLQHVRVHRPLPPAVRRIARLGQISALHAVAFAQANRIGGEVQL